VEIQTERLLLRAWRPDDFEDFARISADPEVMRYIASGQPATRSQAWRAMAVFVGHWSLRGYGLWATEERATGRFIGRIGLWNPEGWPGLEVGWLLDRACWGRGLATEGARAALDYAFTTVGADHVISVIDPQNTRSISVAEKIGERFEREYDLDGNRSLIYGITRPRRPPSSCRVQEAQLE
jgi:RimJ/RimL family protein N-acetyltransferase